MTKWDTIMLTVKQLSKSQFERLIEIEEQFLYMRELPDEVIFLWTRLDELDEKVQEIDVLNYQIDGLPINKLTLRVDSIEHKVARTDSFECGSSASSSLSHIWKSLTAPRRPC